MSVNIFCVGHLMLLVTVALHTFVHSPCCAAPLQVAGCSVTEGWAWPGGLCFLSSPRCGLATFTAGQRKPCPACVQERKRRAGLSVPRFSLQTPTSPRARPPLGGDITPPHTPTTPADQEVTGRSLACRQGFNLVLVFLAVKCFLSHSHTAGVCLWPCLGRGWFPVVLCGLSGL